MSDDADGPAERTVARERSLRPMRRTIASRLQESYREAVHVTVSREVAAGALLAAADAGGESVDPSVTDVLLCALSDALTEHPSFNATFEDGTHRVYEEHNVGVAVTIDQGLVTPVLEDVGAKSLAGIARERRRLTERMQAGEYSMRTFEGGTFTVSNLGPLGVDSFTPIINPPEVAILGVNRIHEEVVPDGDGGVAVETRLTLDLSFDHRVVDGADAARFLGTLARYIDEAETYVT
ncbi:2-oxo acid dehydrogenase subunit E2 [Halobellus ruber]|uniref:2-oxo acid dehydrogenase subunit E2 n=1 Tax=Halobellus ruber TaxID=2761102 RepID=A0A7J9SCU4_9EURY|nr:2-oxo acid dehydrogenase subunit E2 [Halobellus ruber]